MYTQYVFAFGMPGGWELVVIVFLALLFFGAKRIPSLARSIGRGIREFKEGTKEIKSEIEEVAKKEETQSSSEKKA